MIQVTESNHVNCWHIYNKSRKKQTHAVFCILLSTFFSTLAILLNWGEKKSKPQAHVTWSVLLAILARSSIWLMISVGLWSHRLKTEPPSNFIHYLNLLIFNLYSEYSETEIGIHKNAHCRTGCKITWQKATWHLDNKCKETLPNQSLRQIS